MQMAMAKQATIMQDQTTRPRRDLDVEMYLNPWIVELSKKSEKIAKTMLVEGWARMCISRMCKALALY